MKGQASKGSSAGRQRTTACVEARLTGRLVLEWNGSACWPAFLAPSPTGKEEEVAEARRDGDDG